MSNQAVQRRTTKGGWGSEEGEEGEQREWETKRKKRRERIKMAEVRRRGRKRGR